MANQKGLVALLLLPLLAACEQRSQQNAVTTASESAAQPSVRNITDHAPPEFRDIQSESGRYSLKVPADWSVEHRRSDQQNAVTLVVREPQRDPGDRFGENVQVMEHRLPSGVAFTDFVAGYESRSIREGAASLESEPIRLNGAIGHRWIADLNDPKLDLKARAIQYAVDGQSVVYVVKFFGMQSSWEKYADVAEQVLSSFRVENRQP